MSLKARNAISVVVISALAIGAFLFVWKVMLFGPAGPYQIKAEFKDSGGITKNSDVKIGGVPAGTIEEIDLSERDTAIVTMQLDEGYPIGAGAVANSRPVNLLGEKYIELKPGDMSKPQPSGVRIPIERTSRPVELDDMLNILQPDVRARMRIIFNEAGIGLDGRGADFNRVLNGLPAALDETKQFVADFSRDNQALSRAIVQSDRVLGAFNGESKNLQRLVDSAAGTLKITADKRRQIGATLRAAPGTLHQLTTTLSDLGSTATRLEPMFREVRRAAPQLTRTLDQLPDFQQDAGPALDAARKAAPALTDLGRQARRPVERLEPVLGRLDTFAERLQPVVNIADKERGLVGLFNVMNNWENVIIPSDGLGHTFGTQVTVDENSVEHLVDTYLSAIGKGKKKQTTTERTERKPEAPAPLVLPDEPAITPVKKIKLPDLPKLLQSLPVPEQLKEKLQGVGGTVDQVLDQLQKLLGKAGLLGDQSSGRGDGGKGPTGKLIDYLLGP